MSTSPGAAGPDTTQRIRSIGRSAAKDSHIRERLQHWKSIMRTNGGALSCWPLQMACSCELLLLAAASMLFGRQCILRRAESRQQAFSTRASGRPDRHLPRPRVLAGITLLFSLLCQHLQTMLNGSDSPHPLWSRQCRTSAQGRASGHGHQSKSRKVRGGLHCTGVELRAALEEWQDRRAAESSAACELTRPRLTTGFLDGTHPIVDCYELKVPPATCPQHHASIGEGRCFGTCEPKGMLTLCWWDCMGAEHLGVSAGRPSRC